ncbi:MAG: sortase [Clostridia bacterium]|nr:sortase [Clostridia bacterium]
MKNIFEDEFSDKESQDIFNRSGYEYMQNSVKENPEKPQADLDLAFGFEKKEEKTVRSARQAPPPIKRPTAPAPTVPPQPYQAQPQPSLYGQMPVYGQQPVYPQGAFYQPDPTQPYIGYYPPAGQPYPPYAQVPVYGQPPADYQGYPPVMPTPYQVPYQQPPYQAPQPAVVVQEEPAENDAGTRVLFQSDDFDRKEEDLELHETLPHNYNPYNHDFDVSEVELPSTKRAGTPPKRVEMPADFKIDEMEIGTYEFGVMTAGQTSKTSFLDMPANVDENEAFDLTLYEEDYEEEPEKVISEDEAKEIAEKIEASSKKSKNLSSSELIRRAILTVSVVAIIFACYSLYNEYRLHKQNQQVMSNISDLIITEATVPTPTTNPQDSLATTKKPNKTTTKPTTTRPLTPAEQWELLKKENPDLIFPENMQLKYAKLYAQNPDFVGYLYAEGSELDSPIVQGEDDEEYVEKNFYGEDTKYACPFVTARNEIQTLDTNTVIFGHHMRDGSIFACLDQYRTLEGYKEAPVISFNTIYQDYNFKVIATMITNINPEDDNNYVFNYFWTNLNTSLNYSAYLNQLSQRSLYDTGVDVTPSDKLLTLSTCCNDFDDARLVVVARLVRPGESLEVDTSRAVENENPRFPQAYYDEEGTKNPFATAYKWQIS